MSLPYDDNVFINCPFDKEYSGLFDAILFTIYTCGFRPRCALEIDDGGQVRIEKINKIIDECRFGIHDISRTEPDKNSNLPRFNMPFELGIFLGAKRFGSKRHKSKILIILDKEPHRYQQFISDISGQDIKSHDNDPEKLIKCLRDVFNALKVKGTIPGATEITKQYHRFQGALPQLMEQLQLQNDDLTYADKVQLIEQWFSVVPVLPPASASSLR
jgi:hypothetical protein